MNGGNNMDNYTWEEIVEGVARYASSIAEERIILDELEYTNATIDNYPGLRRVIEQYRGNRWHD